MSSVNKTGVYLIGALGSIASTVAAGVFALKKKLAPPTGMVTCSHVFDGVDLIEPADLVFGGCDIRREANSRDIFEKMAPVAPGILMEIKAELEEFHHGIDCGCAKNCGEAIENLVVSFKCERKEPRAGNRRHARQLEDLQAQVRAR